MNSFEMHDPNTERAARAPHLGWRSAAHALFLCAPFVMLLSTKRGWLLVSWVLLLTLGLARTPGTVARAFGALRIPLLACAALALVYLLPEWSRGSAASDELRRVLAPIMVFGIGVITFAARPDPRWIWYGLAAAGVWAGGRAVFEIGVLDLSRNVLGGTNAVAFGDAATLLALACCYGWAANRPGTVRRTLAIGAMAAGVAVVLAQTRGAWLALPLLAGAPLVAARVADVRHSESRGWLAVLLLLPTLAALIVGWERLVGAIDEVRRFFDAAFVDSSVGIRFALWRIAWDQFQLQPWLGVGPAEWKRAVSTWLTTRPPLASLLGIDHAHNDVLDALAQRGLLGLAGYVAFIGSWWVFFLRRRGTSAAAVGGLLVLAAAAVMGLTDAFMYSSTTFFLLCWVLCCFAAISILDGELKAAGATPASPRTRANSLSGV